MAGEACSRVTGSISEEVACATGMRWLDWQVTVQKTFLSVVQPPQVIRPPRASSAPASHRTSGSQEVAVGCGGAAPTKFDEVQTCFSESTSAAQERVEEHQLGIDRATDSGASDMKHKDHEDAHMGFNYQLPTTSDAGLAHRGFNYESPTTSEADIAHIGFNYESLTTSEADTASSSASGLPARESTPVKLLELIEVRAGTSQSPPKGWAGDSDASDSKADGAGFSAESKGAWDSCFADCDFAGPINSTKDFETLQSVRKYNLSPLRSPAGAPHAASAPDIASNQDNHMFLPQRYVGLPEGDGDAGPGKISGDGVHASYFDGSANTQEGLTAGRLSSGWSVGTVLHDLGKCRPCMFAWSEKGCSQGTACEYCHWWHETCERQRPCKGKRVYYRKLLKRMTAAMDSGAYAQEQMTATMHSGAHGHADPRSR